MLLRFRALADGHISVCDFLDLSLVVGYSDIDHYAYLTTRDRAAPGERPVWRELPGLKP